MRVYEHKGERHTLKKIASMECIPIGTIKTRMRSHPELTASECASTASGEFKRKPDPRGLRFECRGRCWSFKEVSVFLAITVPTARSYISKQGIEATLDGIIPPPKKQRASSAKWDEVMPMITEDYEINNLIISLAGLGFKGDDVEIQLRKRGYR